MAKKNIKGHYQHGVYVSAKTKQEFKKNKEQYKAEGIKSAYSLQKQKNIATKTLKLERDSRRAEIKEAYQKEEDIYKEMGIELKDLYKEFNRMEEYNQKIKRAIKQGKLLEDTPLLSFPINRITGKINRQRLQKELAKMKQTMSDIEKKQREKIFNNIKYIFGESVANDVKNKLNGVSTKEIFEQFDRDDDLCVIAIYDERNFEDDTELKDTVFDSRLEYKLDNLYQIVNNLTGSW